MMPMMMIIMMMEDLELELAHITHDARGQRLPPEEEGEWW